MPSDKLHGMCVGLFMGVAASIFVASTLMMFTGAKIVLSARITNEQPR